MGDPISTLSLAVSIIDAFKETYLLGKYVYRTVHSAMNHKAERQEIENDFHFELLKLQTFGRWFQKAHGIITNDAELDQVGFQLWRGISVLIKLWYSSG